MMAVTSDQSVRMSVRTRFLDQNVKLDSRDVALYSALCRDEIIVKMDCRQFPPQHLFRHAQVEQHAETQVAGDARKNIKVEHPHLSFRIFFNTGATASAIIL